MVMGVPPHVALATNKLQGTFGSFTAALNFARKGMINFREVFIGIVFTFIGACVGTVLILFLSAEFLRVIIPFCLIAIFIYTLLMPKVGDEDRAARHRRVELPAAVMAHQDVPDRQGPPSRAQQN